MRSLPDFKKLFRKNIKVVPGGPPVGTPGANRAEGVLAALDALAEDLVSVPVATLYEEPGQHTDGAMTQKATSDALDTKGDLTVQEQHSQQLATLGAQGAPVMVYQRNGATVGYQTLDEALADTTQKVFMRFNTATVTATVSNSAAGWPYYVDGSGSTIFIADGVSLSLPGTSVDALLLSNFFFYFPAYAATGTGKVVLSSRPNTVITGKYAQLLNGYSEVPIQLNGATYEVINGYYASFIGTGTLHVYGNFQAGSIAAGITVVDHRGGAGAGTVKTVNGVAPDAAGEVTLASTDRYEVPQAVRDAVASGTFSSGELLGAAPAGSLAGQKFTTASYGYEYERGVGGGLVWCRYPKG
jgi:hypothetical protein